MTKYVVIGHPRSGTGFAAKCFQSAGKKVGHETLEEDGISSWQWATNEACRGDARTDIGEHILIHIIRNPLNCVPSVAYTEWASLPFRCRHVDIPHKTTNPLTQAIYSIDRWTTLCEAWEPDFTVKAEHFDRFCVGILNLDVSFTNKAYNSRPQPDTLNDNYTQHPIYKRLEAKWQDAL